MSNALRISANQVWGHFLIFGGKVIDLKTCLVLQVTGLLLSHNFSVLMTFYCHCNSERADIL